MCFLSFLKILRINILVIDVKKINNGYLSYLCQNLDFFIKMIYIFFKILKIIHI